MRGGCSYLLGLLAVTCYLKRTFYFEMKEVCSRFTSEIMIATLLLTLNPQAKNFLIPEFFMLFVQILCPVGHP